VTAWSFLAAYTSLYLQRHRMALRAVSSLGVAWDRGLFDGSPGLKAELADPALSRRRISGRFAASEPQDVLTTVADMQGLTLRREASGRLLIER
jgi:hypothetical protein